MPFNGGFYEILHLIEFVQQIYTPKILAFTVNKQLFLVHSFSCNFSLMVNLYLNFINDRPNLHLWQISY